MQHEYKEYDRVLCQDCLRDESFTEAKHEGDILCECGGEFCGCTSCMNTLNALHRKDFERAANSGLRITKAAFTSWNPTTGITVL
ncbi:hypothetical protein 13VV501A_gene0017 [Vibrio phage 13VV501A]|nr:hypothetical protein 13VV501A_gene0017 [Vibrio phage 13VV501A]